MSVCECVREIVHVCDCVRVRLNVCKRLNVTETDYICMCTCKTECLRARETLYVTVTD